MQRTPIQSRRRILAMFFLALSLTHAAAKPNIVMIYADDVGYGDFGCYGAKTIPTPNIDALAKSGIRFTSGYASAATCTPSRYSLITGQYAFRQQGVRILPGNAKALIPAGRKTIATILKSQGYHTGIIGKWHLGLGNGLINWNQPISNTPLDIGFDESFIMAATGDRVPCVYVDGRTVANLDPADPIEVSYEHPFPGLPTGETDRGSLRMNWSHGHNNAVIRDVGRIGYMKGGKSAIWNDEDMMDTYTKRAVKFIESAKPSGKPFFLLVATHDNHVPRLPHPRFVGKTPHGPRGDAVVELDDAVGSIIACLESQGLRDNTLVIVSSDNGPVLDDGYQDQANELLGDHRPAGPFRAGKYSEFEGGTRVPFIVNWPGHVEPAVSEAIISQVDLAASFAALTGHPLADDEAPDSLNVLPALLGQSPKGRVELIEEAKVRSLRSGDWKFIPPNVKVFDGLGPRRSVPTTATGMLFNLAKDPGETTNLASQHPDIAQTMAARLKAIEQAGRSRP